MKKKKKNRRDSVHRRDATHSVFTAVVRSAAATAVRALTILVFNLGAPENACTQIHIQIYMFIYVCINERGDGGLINFDIKLVNARVGT